MKFVDLVKYKFILEPRYYFYGWSNSPRILAREPAVKALLKARSFLPKGYNFKIWDGQRSRKVQIAMAKSFKRKLNLIYPNLPLKKRNKFLSVFAKNPFMRIEEPNTHRQGGALDLTIVDAHKNELYMGTDHDDLTKKAALNYFERKKQLTPLESMARKNRRLLKRVMTKAGFKIYEPEWWHWGFNK